MKKKNIKITIIFLSIIGTLLLMCSALNTFLWHPSILPFDPEHGDLEGSKFMFLPYTCFPLHLLLLLHIILGVFGFRIFSKSDVKEEDVKANWMLKLIRIGFILSVILGFAPYIFLIEILGVLS